MRLASIGSLFFLLAGLALMAGGSAESGDSGSGAELAQRPQSVAAADRDIDAKLVSDPGSAPAGNREFPMTDFSRSIISYSEVLSGGPPKDGIPAVDEPSFATVEQADDWLADTEAVLVVTNGDLSHVYPIQILMWHEIVNDTIGDLPVSVTYCPLCNSSLAFRREFDGQILDFGTSGRLRFSNMLIYDRQSETWWQQAEGQGVIGKYAGRFLDQVPALMLPWETVRERYPKARVVSRETGHSRPYGSNPYTGYDESAFPFLFQGPEINGDNSPMTRVVAISHNGESKGYPYPNLQEEVVVNDRLAEEPVVIIWQPGTASPLDSSSVSSGRDVGSANGFLAVLDGQSLTFRAEGDRIIDEQTGSVWDVSGTAVKGKLKGKSLDPVVTVQHFWFSWTAFEVPTGG
jgi:hypothetical protein